MTDPGTLATDKAYAAAMKKIESVYRKALKDLTGKMRSFNKLHAQEDKKKRALLAAGEITQDQYTRWLRSQVFQGQRWEEKVREAAETLNHANAEAASLVQAGRLTAFAANANYGAYKLEHDLGLNTGWTLYSRESVSRIIANNPKMLPEWKIDEPKDYIWNERKVQDIVTQGIIQGESIPEITDRMVEGLQTQNENKMRNFARTAMTGAQNAGRIDSMHHAQDLGIKIKKKWLATRDARTRDAHEELDGQVVEIDEPFVTHNRDGSTAYIDHPGDPNADAEQVYNCRCTMVNVYPDLDDIPEDTEPDPEAKQMTFDEWMEAKENREAVQGQVKTENVEVKDEREQPKSAKRSELSEDTRESIDAYIEGRGNNFTPEEVEEIKAAMTQTEEPLYRVEDMSWMAENLEAGDTFTFDKPLKGFTQDFDGVRTIVAEGEDAGLYEDQPVVIFETQGTTDHLDVSGMSRNHEDEHESLVGGTFRVVDEFDGPTINGRQTWVMQIEQVDNDTPGSVTENIAAHETGAPALVNSDDFNVRTADYGGGEYTKAEKDELLTLAGGRKLDLDENSSIRMMSRHNGDTIKIETPDAELMIKTKDETVIIDDFNVRTTGQGAGTEIFSEIADEAGRQGYNEISLFGAGEKGDVRNGYYTWARLGFDGDLTSRQITEAREHGFIAERVSDLMKTPEGRAYWKENGHGIEMTFDLKDGSYSRRTLEEYRHGKHRSSQ